MTLFTDRVDAGRQLAERVRHLAGEDVVVLGLPRGGVPVAFEVAQVLEAPLDVAIVRKLGVPFQPELAMGAVGEGGARCIDEAVVRNAGVLDGELEAVEHHERAEVGQRSRRIRARHPIVPLAGRTALVVDDGLATGSTARAACWIARARGAARVVLAVPVAPQGWTVRLRGVADELVTVAAPARFGAIGQFYEDFAPTSDAEVERCLRLSREPGAGTAGVPPGKKAHFAVELEVTVGEPALGGHLVVPERSRGVVVFAHGSGSSRHSPRNRFVASVLHEARIGTLLIDLLTPEEEVDRVNVFDIEFLAGRLAHAARWLGRQEVAADLPVGIFGASTGAAAALWAAAAPGAEIAAVVSRGGRPDLAWARLASVRAPTLLVVGGHDHDVLELNRQVLTQLRCEHRLAVVPGATHLFEEPGTLAAAAALARDWFAHYMSVTPRVVV